MSCKLVYFDEEKNYKKRLLLTKDTLHELIDVAFAQLEKLENLSYDPLLVIFHNEDAVFNLGLDSEYRHIRLQETSNIELRDFLKDLQRVKYG